MKNAIKSLLLLTVTLTGANAHAINLVRAYDCAPERSLSHAAGISVTFRTTGILPNAGHYCTVEIEAAPGLGHGAVDKKVEMNWDEDEGEWKGSYKGTPITAYEVLGRLPFSANVMFGSEAYECSPAQE